MLHPFARMGITGMHRMRARLTVTTARVGLPAASLSELDPGSTGLAADTGAVAAFTDVAVLQDAALLVAEPDSPEEAGLHEAGLWHADRLEVDSVVVARAPSTAAAGSMAVVVASTVEAMAVADTGN
jgi:hypothetical protein